MKKRKSERCENSEKLQLWFKKFKNAKLGYLWLHSSQDGEHIECKLITEICINYTISVSATCHIKKNNYLQKLSLKKTWNLGIEILWCMLKSELLGRGNPFFKIS